MPERTCVVCRKTAEQHSLMRFVISEQGAVVVDLCYVLPGRGVYVHTDCLTVKGIARKVCSRFLKNSGTNSLLKTDDKTFLNGVLLQAKQNDFKAVSKKKREHAENLLDQLERCNADQSIIVKETKIRL